MHKFLVLMVCMIAVSHKVSSVERMRRQYPNYNQMRAYNNPLPQGSPYEPTSWKSNVQEPTNYEFRYDVDLPEYGTKHGHQELRQGDVARGKYYVLLPDGRTQTVEYTADQNGYHPIISYQGGFTHGGLRGNVYY